MSTRFRRPEYTGENRCIPCTVVNSIIAVGVTGVLTTLNPILGICSVVASAILLYYRGYLIPGAPTITKRYMPDRVLEMFGKEPILTTPGFIEPNNERFDDTTEFNTLSLLLRHGVIQPTDDGEDIELTTVFKETFPEVNSDDPISRAEAVFQSHFQDLSIDGQSDVPYLINTADTVLLSWTSETALRIDAQSAQALDNFVPNTEALNKNEYFSLLQSIRALREICPKCGDVIRFTQQERETCCQTYTANVLSCDSCGDTLLEVNDSALNEPL